MMLFNKYFLFEQLFMNTFRSNKKRLFFSQNLFKKNFHKSCIYKKFKNYFSFYFFYFEFNKINLQKNYGILFKNKLRNNLLKLNFFQFKNKKYIFYKFYINFLNFTF